MFCKELFFILSNRFSMDPLWQKAYAERLAPYIDKYPSGSTQELFSMLYSDPESALFDNFFAVR